MLNDEKAFAARMIKKGNFDRKAQHIFRSSIKYDDKTPKNRPKIRFIFSWFGF